MYVRNKSGKLVYIKKESYNNDRDFSFILNSRYDRIFTN